MARNLVVKREFIRTVWWRGPSNMWEVRIWMTIFPLQ